MKADRESIQAVNAFMQNLDVVDNVHLSIIDVLPTNFFLLVVIYWLHNIVTSQYLLYWSLLTNCVGICSRGNGNRMRMPFDVVNSNEKNTRKIRSCVSSVKVHEWTEWMNESQWMERIYEGSIHRGRISYMYVRIMNNPFPFIFLLRK